MPKKPSPQGTILGRIFNAATKEPLYRATVIVLGTKTGAMANESGHFRIDDVPVGTYAIRASLVGFEPSIRTDVVISPSRSVEIVFALNQVSVQLEEVTITERYFQKSPDALLSTQTQGDEEIRRLPGGFEDVVRAVSILPGVTATFC